MLRSLQQFFERNVGAGDADGDDAEARLRLATAALFVEMTRADFQVAEIEETAVLQSIVSTLGVDRRQAAELFALAKQEADDSIEVFQFTRLVDEAFGPERKVEVVERLWEVALADRKVDAHEEHLVRKIANLLHVPHKDFIAAKKRARARRS